MSDKCKNVITIPQSDDIGSCWFNTLLMSILYSQNSRKLLLNDNYLERRPPSDKTSKLLNQLLRKNYIQHDNAYDYFKYMRPEKILKYLNIIKDKDLFKEKLKKGFDPRMFIHHFIKRLGKSSLQIDIYGGQLYANFNIIYGHLEYQGKFLNAQKLLNLEKQDFKSDPDYIIVNPLQDNESDGEYEKMFYTSIRFNPGLNILDKLSLDNRGIATDGILSLDKKITYDGETYILDSCILGNFNPRSVGGHVITGITCNNKRYVYNGWIRDIIDDTKKELNPKILPCELMKYYWDPNSSDAFCLNMRTCQLDAAKDPTKTLCFSFNVGLRCLIYVKETRIKDKGIKYDENYSSISDLILPSDVSKDREEFNKFKLRLKEEKDRKEKEIIKETLKKKEERKRKEALKLKDDEVRKQLIKLLKPDKPKKKEPKLIINMKSVIKKIKDPYLNLMYFNNSYYLIEYCEHNIIKLLTLRNPKYIIIDKNNNYDRMLIDKIPKIEYLTKLNNYGLYINKSASYNQIIYNNHYHYELYAYSNNGIFVYKNIDKKKTPIKIAPKILFKKEFREEKIKIVDPKKIKCVKKYLDYDKDFSSPSSSSSSPPKKRSPPKKPQSPPKKPLLSKDDYIKEIKKMYPYYENADLQKLDVQSLQHIYNLNCSTINLNYENNSCYLDSVMVALFNNRNRIIRDIILKSPLNNYNNATLDRYGENIRQQLISLYEKIIKPPSEIGNNKCNILRRLFQRYYTVYKTDVNPANLDDIEWTSTQNDFNEFFKMLDIVFDIPLNVSYSMNKNKENRIFFDINNDIDVYVPVIKISDYYPRYTKIVDLNNSGVMRREEIEYISAPLLLIQIKRNKIGAGKMKTPVIPEKIIKLRANNLYLNSIIIHIGDDNAGHYISLYECKGKWYKYDDMKGHSVKIGNGTFDEVVSNSEYTENIVGLLYYSLA
jgi:hypothetical protein